MSDLLGGMMLALVVGISSYLAVATTLDTEYENKQQMIDKHIELVEGKQ